MEKVEKTQKMFEGSYEYLNKNVTYSQEDFVVFRSEDGKSVIYRSEQLTRVGTGEFLKINTDYVVNGKYNPTKVTVVKSLGMDIATERYIINYEKNLMNYLFVSENSADEDAYSEKEIEVNLPNKFHLVTPSFTSSMVFTHANKFSTIGRNPFIMVRTHSDWEFSEETTNTPIYLELLTHEKTELKINDQDLSCTKVHVYQHDSSAGIPEKPSLFYISRHVGIPYKLETHDELVIQIKNLKKHENFYSNMY